ncbi:MAG TPA: DUF5701 family protein [Marmoricola sp.]|nr:DUF5701 family protein [Marmoricola sp.]
MKISEQLQRLIALGVHELAGLSEADFQQLGVGLPDETLAVVSPRLVPPSRLAPLLSLNDKPGFVVEDMTDVDEFVDQVDAPERLLYTIASPKRGDELQNYTPDEALAALAERGLSPLTLNEGISWLLQQPQRLERNSCFMTIGSRKPKARGFDARTPAIWVSNGTGRDGKERQDAPKVGWCWWNNRHTWLGFAATEQRYN